jgi:hypothetical protein
MRRWLIISVLWLVAVAAATTFRVPWERPHPTDPSLSILLGYAPLWSHRFTQTYSAHPDGVHLMFALFLAFLLPLTLAADSLIGRRVSHAAGSIDGEPSTDHTASGSFRREAEGANLVPFPEARKSASGPASRQA